MRNDYTSYLAHGHKYDAKKWIKGKWRYFYDYNLGGLEKKRKEKADIEAANAETNYKVKVNYDNKMREEWKKKNPSIYKDYDSSETGKKNQKARNSANTRAFEAMNAKEKADVEYNKTVLGKLDKAKARAKGKIEKIFAKQIAEADAKKTAKQRTAREEGMAAEAKAKTEKQHQTKLAYQQRAVEKEHIKTLNALNKDRREHGYADAEKQKQDAINRKRIDDRVDNLINKSNKLTGDRFKDQLAYTGAYLNAKHNNRAMTPEEMNDYILYYNSAKEKQKVINGVNEKARIAQHIKTIMDKTDGDVPEYLNKMLNDPYSASEEFWETLADNIQKPKRKNK